MPAGVTYSTIATTTLGSNQTTISFNSFSGYTDLLCIYSARNSSATGQDVYVQFNGDTGSNYSATLLYGTGSAAGSYRNTNDAAILLDFYGTPGPTSGSFNTGQIHIMNYSNSTTYKTTLSRTGRVDSGVDAGVGLWRNTAAITSMLFKLSGSGNQFTTGSTFTLYGIAAA